MRRSILAASLASPFLASPVFGARRPAPAALLVPLSGERAAIGRSMARAAALAQGQEKDGLIVLDTAGGAAAAARAAIRRGAGLILGPLATAEVRPVLAEAAGRVAVVTFSNDEGLRESGAFLIGITADQRVGALCRYARGRGLRRIAIAGGQDAWGAQVAAAARRAASREGLDLVGAAAEADGLLLAAPAAAPASGGLQYLCAFGEGDADATGRAALEGAWLAAPDPAGFASFAAGFEAANGSEAGLIAALAYDASAMAAQLRRGGGGDRSALLAPGGFPGVCGAFRFRDDGSANRRLAILAIDRGAYRVVDTGDGKTTNG